MLAWSRGSSAVDAAQDDTRDDRRIDIPAVERSERRADVRTGEVERNLVFRARRVDPGYGFQSVPAGRVDRIPPHHGYRPVA